MEEGAGLCSESAEQPRHYPREILRLRPDVPGAKMWAVALEKTMLTYFEIEPHSHFARHSHSSEQITMVLEGSVFFEVGETTHVVEQGEVIAIPSNIPHAVYTKEEGAKAVDAWSPAMEKYGSTPETE
jgi:quercetin dioxygenase-like cupin family protein